MIKFILNDKLQETAATPGQTVLDYVRYQKHLTGTKIGCREGDCGACTVLVGDLNGKTKSGGDLRYESMTSCLMPLANAHGKHIVTVEGINMAVLSPVQKAIVEEGGTQCGFCTVGFVLSLTGFAMQPDFPNYEDAIAAMDGNICRCTGYKSLERAAERLCETLAGKHEGKPLAWLVKNNFLPPYFGKIKQRLNALKSELAPRNGKAKNKIVVGGGTDLYVQRPEELHDANILPVFDHEEWNTITRKGKYCYVGGACTAETIRSHKITNTIFPNIKAHMKLVSSTPIRNMGTLAGNLVNASPIGDLTIFFLALDASIILSKNGKQRELKLKDFYKGYKVLDKKKDEVITTIFFKVPGKNDHFSFEKVCKRTHLDIASVNSACLLSLKNNVIQTAHLSAGGVAPIPKYLSKTSAYLTGKKLTVKTIAGLDEILQSEVAPISDARGTTDYKRLLLRQLVFAHLEKLVPGSVVEVLGDV